MDRHAFVLAHWDKITLQVAQLRRKATLVHRERTQAALPGVAVGLHDHPSRHVADAEIQGFGLLDQRVETLHQLGDLGGVVLAVNVELYGVSLQNADCGVNLDRTRSM